MIRFGLQQIITLDRDARAASQRRNGSLSPIRPRARQQHSAPLKETGYTEPARLEMLPEMLAQSEWELLRSIDVYPRRRASAAAQLAPHVLAAYAFELASHFTDFYEHTCKSQQETGHFSNTYPGGHVVWDNVSTRIRVGFSL
jgi:arginyl-tRNA synthetase